MKIKNQLTILSNENVKLHNAQDENLHIQLDKIHEG